MRIDSVKYNYSSGDVYAALKTDFGGRFFELAAFRALFWRELKNRVASPVSYTVLLSLYLGLAVPFTGSGYWFSAGFSDFRAFFLPIPFLLSFTIPLLTMNTWTDEKKYHTDKLLASYPMTVCTLALGKYAALLVWVCLMGVVVLCIPLATLPLVYFDFFSFMLSAVSVLLFSAALAALSLACSALSDHTAVSFLFSFFVCILVTVSDALSQLVQLPAWIEFCVRACSCMRHFESAARGVFDTRDIMFPVLLLIFGLWLTVSVLTVKKR